MPDQPGILDFTGERMVPEAADARLFWEHVYRYRFAARHVNGKRVLDIACGEGYGAHSLKAAGASSVIGVDISEQACSHARAKYGVDARQGDAENIPLPDTSVDVVVSFETIEHVARPDVFLDECLRVLTPGGRLIISTPNVEVYRENGHHNPFHCSEMTEQEFLGKLQARYHDVNLYCQCYRTAGWWSPRALAAEQTFWKHLRGFWRLSNALCPYRRGVVEDRYRRSPAEAVLAREWAVSTLLNPFALHPRAPRSGERPVYFVAMARRP